MPSGAIAIIGWMVGTSWLTLAMSVLPAFMSIGPSSQPAAVSSRRQISSSVWLLTIVRIRFGASVTSTVVPVACAAASAISRKRSIIGSRSSSIGVRRNQRPLVRSGTMFGAAPPWVMMPCTRSRGFRCCRHWATIVYSSTIASSALRPSHGSALACASLPWKVTSTSVIARQAISALVRSDGWIWSATSTSSKTPCSIIVTLPLPASSAGVPMNRISPAKSSPSTRAAAMAAPALDEHMRLWPQPWPTSGSASYSPRKAITGPGRAPCRRATNAVSSPADRTGDLEPVALEQLGRPGSGLPLLVRDLGVGVDAVRQLEGLGQDLRHAGRDPVGGGGRRHRCLR